MYPMVPLKFSVFIYIFLFINSLSISSMGFLLASIKCMVVFHPDVISGVYNVTGTSCISFILGDNFFSEIFLFSVPFLFGVLLRSFLFEEIFP